MTREEKQKAIKALKISAPVMAVTHEEFNDYVQTLNKIMDLLEQEPCEDCVSRKAVEKAIKEMLEWINGGNRGTCDYQIVDEIERIIKKLNIENLPSVQPARTKAKWLDNNNRGTALNPSWDKYVCSNCGHYSDLENYCANCGVEMEDEE